MDFSCNYENKQLHEIQSAYFGHEAFTVFTCVYYHRSFDTEVMYDEESGLKLIPATIISNEVTHEQNTAYHCNQKVIQMVQNKLNQIINTVYIWSDGCASQFWSQYVFQTLSFYPASLKVFWDYGKFTTKKDHMMELVAPLSGVFTMMSGHLKYNQRC